MILSSLAWADPYTADTNQGIYTPGPYVGAQVGYGIVKLKNHHKWEDFLRTKGDLTRKRIWFGSGVNVGWSFFRYFSLEGGYIDYPHIEYDLIQPDQTEYSLMQIHIPVQQYLFLWVCWSNCGVKVPGTIRY